MFGMRGAIHLHRERPAAQLQAHLTASFRHFRIGGTQVSTRSSGPDPSDQTSENPSEPVSLIEHYLRKWWEHLQRPSLVRRKLRELETACDNERPESSANQALEHYREFVIGFAKAGWTREQSESICMLVCFVRQTHICALQC